MATLDLDHFLKAHEMLAAYYGTQAPTLAGVALAYKSMMSEAPNLTAAQFDYAVQKSVVRCRFHPRVVDFFQELFEADMSNAPSMPDIDPRYADGYQLSTYYKAKAALDKYCETAPRDPKVFRNDRLKEIPELPFTPASECSGIASGWSGQGLLEAERSGSPDNFLGF